MLLTQNGNSKPRKFDAQTAKSLIIPTITNRFTNKQRAQKRQKNSVKLKKGYRQLRKKWQAPWPHDLECTESSEPSERKKKLEEKPKWKRCSGFECGWMDGWLWSCIHE